MNSWARWPLLDGSTSGAESLRGTSWSIEVEPARADGFLPSLSAVHRVLFEGCHEPGTLVNAVGEADRLLKS